MTTRKRLNERAQTAKGLFKHRWQPISHPSPEGTRAAACRQNANEAAGGGRRRPASTSADETLAKEAVQVHLGKPEQATGGGGKGTTQSSTGGTSNALISLMNIFSYLQEELPGAAASITTLEIKISRALG